MRARTAQHGHGLKNSPPRLIAAFLFFYGKREVSFFVSFVRLFTLFTYFVLKIFIFIFCAVFF
jgi:hypothetical protein